MRCEPRSSPAIMSTGCALHRFDDAAELARLRAGLLKWYDDNKRDLPWRTVAASESDGDVRAYAVWVSEVMLQQTQVATVVDYYARWMRKWPTIQLLAEASLEEVRQMWSGLGYYSRAERLWKAAKEVVEEQDGHLPSTAAELARSLHGVGRYTAGAIASIAFGQVCGVVDGNVIRVLSRLRAIAADVSSPRTMEHFWFLADSVVDASRPGDFNQALMELGALTCTPKAPRCQVCPISDLCTAHRMATDCRLKGSLHRYCSGQGGGGQGRWEGAGPADVEDCCYCLPKDRPWDASLGEVNFPRKARKKLPRIEHLAVGVVEGCERGISRVMLRQRPETGLLAGLWEFPCTRVQADWSEERMWKELKGQLHLSEEQHQFVGKVTHLFSHVKHHYHVWHIPLKELLPSDSLPSNTGCKWVSCSELEEAAVSAAVRKIHRMVSGAQAAGEKPRGNSSALKRRVGDRGGKVSKRQRTMDAFFAKDIPQQ